MTTEPITEAGVYDLPVDLYHADPVTGGSLSSSGARKLLPPHCPAHFAYERDHPRDPTKVFELGHVAHRLVLGRGADIVVVDADNWRTKAAQNQQAAARLEGKTPVLRDQYQQVQEMAEALLKNPLAAALFRVGSGTPEQTLVWLDELSGVWCRALLDWLPGPTGSRMILVDYKTAKSAHQTQFAKAAADYGYYMQIAWYLAGIKALGLDDDPAGLFVVQEKEPPYLSNVIELDGNALRIGRSRNREAIEVYAECVRANSWPGYSDEVELVGLPLWFERQYDDAFA